MIKFLIHSSLDQNIIGEHQYFFNKVILSSKPHAQLVIEDESLNYFGLILQVSSEEGILVNTLPVNQYYHHNGKKIAGTKLVTRNCQIKFGSTVLEIIDFRLDKYLADLPLPQRIAQASTKSDNKKLLEVLEEELIHLEHSRER